MMLRLEGAQAINIEVAKVMFMIIDYNFGSFSDVFDDITKHDITFKGGKQLFVKVKIEIGNCFFFKIVFQISDQGCIFYTLKTF